VCGLNSPVRHEVVRDAILAAWPAIVCSQEMKLSSISAQLVEEIVGHHFDIFEFLSANGTRGGILLAWHSDHFEATGL
jgi:hypothetical protein